MRRLRSMASPKYQSVKVDDPDNFRLSSLDDDSRPKILLQHYDLELGDPPDAPLPIEEKAKMAKSGSGMMTTWVIINTLTTICIVSLTPLLRRPVTQSNLIQVFLNKAIFNDPHLRHAQLSFVTYHFALTGMMLYTLSRPSFAWFEPNWGKASQIFPIAIMFGFQVVLPNCSLAYSSIVFYQMARVLLTPFTAMINFFMYKKSISRLSALWLVPVCVGVGILSYYEAVPQNPLEMRTTSILGVFFAFSGTLASAIYTVWIKVYQVRLDMSPAQLLANQAPYGALILLYLVPFTDTFPALTEVSMNRWTAIFLVRHT